jgi:trimeric autotransporter adhesin
LNIEGIRNIDTLYDIFLIDHYKKDSLDMRRYGSYAFNIYTSDTSSFGGSRFELSIHPRPLPAYELLNFAAQKASEGVQLNWKTENEANYTGFVLQKLDGTVYNQLNSQQSNSGGSYSFIDHNPIVGANTYRLQQSGITGSITYSSPVTIIYSRSGADGAISVYPNPVKDEVNLIINQNSSSSTSGTITIQSSAPTSGSVSYGIKIMNITGAVVMATICSDSEWHQSAVSLAPGTYIIQVTNNKDNSLVGKSLFVKL